MGHQWSLAPVFVSLDAIWVRISVDRGVWCRRRGQPQNQTTTSRNSPYAQPCHASVSIGWGRFASFKTVSRTIIVPVPTAVAYQSMLSILSVPNRRYAWMVDEWYWDKEHCLHYLQGPLRKRNCWDAWWSNHKVKSLELAEPLTVRLTISGWIRHLRQKLLWCAFDNNPARVWKVNVWPGESVICICQLKFWCSDSNGVTSNLGQGWCNRQDAMWSGCESNYHNHHFAEFLNIYLSRMWYESLDCEDLEGH